MRAAGSPGTWESQASPRPYPEPGNPAHKPAVRRRRCPAAMEAQAGHTKHGTQTWYRQAKATKRGGRDARASDRLVVPLKPGNLHSEGTRWREGAERTWNL
jgi:hypothetical protein